MPLWQVCGPSRDRPRTADAMADKLIETLTEFYTKENESHGSEIRQNDTSDLSTKNTFDTIEEHH